MSKIQKYLNSNKIDPLIIMITEMIVDNFNTKKLTPKILIKNIKKATKKYLFNKNNKLDIEEIKNTGNWKSYTDSLPRDWIYEKAVKYLKKYLK